MRKAISVLIVLICSVAIFGQKPDNGNDLDGAYQSFVTKVKGGDTTVDFRAFRIAYSNTKAYGPHGGDGEKELFSAISRKDYEGALKKAEKMLGSCYVDMDAHVGASMAYRGLGDESKADFHKKIYIGLINSILTNGDGKSAATAYVVITLHEEYIVLRALDLVPGSQSLVHQDGHSFDVLSATDRKSNSTIKLYFNIDIPWKAETDMFK